MEPSRRDVVHVRAVSYESLALRDPLRYPTPLSHIEGCGDEFDYWWHLIEYAFPDLQDPLAFRALPEAAFSAHHRRIAERFLAAATELAGYSFLRHPTRVSITPPIGDQRERIEADFPSREVIRGFSTLFRQLHTTDSQEPARFLAVHKAISAANELAADEHAVERRLAFKAWRGARGRLLAYPLKVLVGYRLREEGRWSADKFPGEDAPSPDQLISIYNYGEDIHWGDHSSTVAAWESDPYFSAMRRQDFFEAMTGLAHLYIGFSALIYAALGRSG